MPAPPSKHPLELRKTFAKSNCRRQNPTLTEKECCKGLEALDVASPCPGSPSSEVEVDTTSPRKPDASACLLIVLDSRCVRSV